jgi:hypothetical protein
MIRKGQIVQILPQWQDSGDDKYTWIAVDDEEKGRVSITPLGTGLAYPPINTVRIDMLVQRNEDSQQD